MEQTTPSMPEGFPVIPEADYRAILDKIDDRIVEATPGGKWSDKKACWWRFKIIQGEYKGVPVGESTIMPFNADGTPVAEELRSKCWRWRDLCTTIYGGTKYPEGIPWDEFKEKVCGTEWIITVLNRKYEGRERSEVTNVKKPDTPF